MPRHKGKKKKGKVVRAQDMKDTVKTAMVNNLNEKLLGAGLAKVKGLSNLELPSNKTAAASGEGTDSQLDESVYSYYSQSVNQSALNDDLNSASGAPATEGQVDVNNIRADINASEQEEFKGEANAPRQVLTTRGE